MDLILKSKHSVSLCNNCKYIQECNVFKETMYDYDVLSCPMNEPQELDNCKEIKIKGDKIIYGEISKKGKKD